jgi:predicted RNase H-like HicB family nuclease
MKKTVKYTMVIEFSAEDGCYVARAPELPGCQTDGETPESAMKNLYDAMDLYLKSLKARKIPAPVPFADRKFSGKFPVRTNPEKHRQIAEAARRADMSVNEFVVNSAIEKSRAG